MTSTLVTSFFLAGFVLPSVLPDALDLPLAFHGFPLLIKNGVSKTGSIPPFLTEKYSSSRHLLYTNISSSKHDLRWRTSLVESIPDSRLPLDVFPLHYLVKLCPEVQDPFNFSGSVEIQLEVKRSTNYIVLHGVGLTIGSVSLEYVGKSEDEEYKHKLKPVKKVPKKRKNSKYKGFHGIYKKYIKVSRQLISKENFTEKENEAGLVVRVSNLILMDADQQIKIELADHLQENHIYKLKMEFSGFAGTKLQGMYKTHHTDEEGNVRVSLATQFQTNYARTVFPCFDEPLFRSSFTLILCRAKGYRTVSNMPKTATLPRKDREGMVWDIFRSSAPMPTYLIGFAILDDFATSVCINSTFPFRVWAPKKLSKGTRYGCDLTPRLFAFFEEYFGVPYALPKMDFVALSDFFAKGMENWGIVTFTLDHLLIGFDSETTFLQQERRVLDTISHEVTHQWFGNLVSPSWWSDIWLNEGFATYFSLLGFHHVRPSYQIEKDYILNVLHKALIDDALNSTHPLVFRTIDRDDHYAIFDGITYAKGCFVVRMMMHALSEEVFNSGIKKYLIQKGYQSVSQEDLWIFLNEAAVRGKVLPEGVTMKEIMDTWTLQDGYPVLHVRRLHNDTLSVTQERFFVDTEEQEVAMKNNQTTGQRWWIPVSMATKQESGTTETLPKFWVESHTHTFSPPTPVREGDWFLLNLQQTGFYRVNYDRHNWLLLSEQLLHNHLVFDEITRAQLIDDAFSLAYSGKLDYEVVLELIRYVKDEKSPFALKAMLQNLDDISPEDLVDPIFRDSSKLVLSLLIPHYPKQGFEYREGELPFVRSTTNMLVKTICNVYERCIEEAQQTLVLWFKGTDLVMIEDDLLSVILSVGFTKRSRSELDSVYEQFATATDSERKTKYLKVLSSSGRQDLIRKLLGSLSSDLNNKTNVNYLQSSLAIIAMNPSTTDLAWSFLQQIWPRLVELEEEFALFTAVVPHLKTEKQYAQLTSFMETSLGRSMRNRDFASSVAQDVHRKILFKWRRMEGVKKWRENREQLEIHN